MTLLLALTLLVEGLLFEDVRQRGSHMIGHHSDYILKISRNTTADNREIRREGMVMRYLNEAGCKSCPQIYSIGTLDSGAVYLIEQRIHSNGVSKNWEKVLDVYMQQKHYGVFQGDVCPSNCRYDGAQYYLIDYGMAKIDPEIIHLSNEKFIEKYYDQFEKIPGL